MSTPRIILLTTSFPRHTEDEAGIFVARLVEALSQNGAEGTVIVPADTTAETLTQLKSFTIERARYGLFVRGSLAFGAGIIPNLKMNPLRVLQAPGLLLSLAVRALRKISPGSIISAHWIVPGVAAWLVWILKATPYTITVRGEDFRLLKLPLLGAALRPALKNAHALITVSQEFSSALKALPGIRSEKVHCIENGCDSLADDTTSEDEHFKSLAPYLLFVGTVIPRKRVDLLLELLSLESLRDYSLVICGRTEDRDTMAELTQQITAKGLSARVHFQGSVAPRLIAGCLKHAAAYVTASEFEGRPNAVLEALAAGKVVLASNIAAHREIITSEQNGILFEPANMVEAADRLSQLLANAAACARFSEAAQQSVREFTWQRCAERYLSIFRSIRG